MDIYIKDGNGSTVTIGVSAVGMFGGIFCASMTDVDRLHGYKLTAWLSLFLKT